MNLKHLIIFFGLFIGLTAVFTHKTSIFLDPDFGWHITTGRYILQHGIPYHDLFSYTMPHFPFIAHSWLSEVFFAISYPYIAYRGIAILLSITAVSTLFIATSKYKPIFMLPMILLGASDIVIYMGVRPQVFSWLFFALFIHLLFAKVSFRLQAIGIFLIVTLWSNLHGSFALGIGLLILKFLYEAKYKKTSLKNTATLIIIAFIASCINPYGISIWKEVLLTFFNPGIRFGINEWLPGALNLSFYSIPHIALSLVLVTKFHSYLDRFKKIMYIILFLFAMTSSKLYPFWSVYSLYVSVFILKKFYDSLPNKLSKERFNIFLALISIFALFLFALNANNSIRWYKKYAENSFYPTNAIIYLQKNQPQNNIFSLFAWGGYLIWQFPEKKVFVDGRMTYWNNEKPPLNESKNALKEYQSLIRGKASFIKAASRYKIDTVLLPKNDPAFKKILSQLKKNHWKRIYQDSVAEIYVHPVN